MKTLAEKLKAIATPVLPNEFENQFHAESAIYHNKMRHTHLNKYHDLVKQKGGKAKAREHFHLYEHHTKAYYHHTDSIK